MLYHSFVYLIKITKEKNYMRKMIDIGEELSSKIDEIKKQYGSSKIWLIKTAINFALQFPQTVWGWGKENKE